MNLRAMLGRRLSLGPIRRGSIITVSGKVTYLEDGDIKNGVLENMEFKVVEIGNKTLRVKNDKKDILLTSADKVTVKGDKDGQNKHS